MYFLNLILVLIFLLEYLIIRRFYNLEIDFIFLNKEGITKKVHNIFFFNYPYFVDLKNIYDIKIYYKWFLANIFNVWWISISTWKIIYHYDFLKNPNEIYKVILELLKFRKNKNIS